VHAIKPGLIRVDADEATYPLHIVLRFELEKDLVSGKLAARDIPDAWDAKMREYLGLATLDNPKDGPMQDVHWPAGAFGYFPSYTLGALIAAQIMAAMERDMPSVRADIAAGHFDDITQWRRDRIWQVASRKSIGEIIANATGEALDPQYFLNHLERRYLN
jgi:carboxypeptidase Taq